MIIAILIIIFTISYIVACMFGAIIYKFSFPVLLICGPILTGAIVKIYNQTKKYGMKSVFRFSHNSTENEQMNLVEHILNKQQGTHIIKIDDSKLICVSTSGIYLIKILEYAGRIEGNETDETFILKDNGTTRISNFFLELKELEEQIPYSIQKIIIKKEICMLDSSYSREYQVIGIHHFHFEFQKMNKEIQYTEEVVESIYEEIKQMSKNVKLQ